MRLPTEIIQSRRIASDLERKAADLAAFAQRIAPTDVVDGRSDRWARAVAYALRELPVGASDAAIVERAKAHLRGGHAGRDGKPTASAGAPGRGGPAIRQADTA
jgi:hypothetical protein